MNPTHDHTDPFHVCIWECPSYEPSALEFANHHLTKQVQGQQEELQRLRMLLRSQNIDYTKPGPINSLELHQEAHLGSIGQLPVGSTNSLPLLPNELISRVVSLLVTSSGPIIDPFWKQRPENLTQSEKSQKPISVGFLATSKAFHAEGTRLIFTNNQFVFTQVAALQNFSKFPTQLRSFVKDLTIRVVGRYYDAKTYVKNLTGPACYNEELPYLPILVSTRPIGTSQDKGIQSYCWQQVSDFLQALSLPDLTHRSYTKCLPLARTLRLDLVNFCEHLPFAGSYFISVIRWQIGQIFDELVVTGAPEEDWANGEEVFLGALVKNEGVFATGCPIFVSKRGGLESLSGYDLNVRIVRPDPPLGKLPFQPDQAVDHQEPAHPEGDNPPESRYPFGTTLWRFTSNSLKLPEKKWIEFHRGCGYPVSECGELDSDDEEMNYGLDSDSDSDNPENWDYDDDDDDDEDDDDL